MPWQVVSPIFRFLATEIDKKGGSGMEIGHRIGYDDANECSAALTAYGADAAVTTGMSSPSMRQPESERPCHWLSCSHAELSLGWLAN